MLIIILMKVKQISNPFTVRRKAPHLAGSVKFWKVFKDILEGRANYLDDGLEYMGLRSKKSRHNGIIKKFVRTKKHLDELVER